MIAVPGSIGFMISGQSATNLPDYSIGYVNLFYAAMIVPLTILFVPVGVRVCSWQVSKKKTSDFIQYSACDNSSKNVPGYFKRLERQSL